MKRLIAATLTSAALIAGGILTAAPAHAGRDIGDGTGYCHRWVQVWYNGPWVCLY